MGGPQIPPLLGRQQGAAPTPPATAHQAPSPPPCPPPLPAAAVPAPSPARPRHRRRGQPPAMPRNSFSKQVHATPTRPTAAAAAEELEEKLALIKGAQGYQLQ